MFRRRVSKLGSAVLAALALTLAALSTPACASNHRVSPWGDAGRPTLSPYLAGPNLEAHLAAIDAEIGSAGLGLGLAQELEAPLPGDAGKIVLRGYEGADSLGRRATATRAATPFGIVLAVGPSVELSRAEPADRSERATELVLELGPLDLDPLPAGAPEAPEGRTEVRFRSLSDLNGDGALDVVLRNHAGAVEIWRLGRTAASPYPVRFPARPSGARDVDGDGLPELEAALPVAAGDPIAPKLVAALGFSKGAYGPLAPGAVAHHAAEAARRAFAEPADPRERLELAVERAFYRVLSEPDSKGALEELDRATGEARGAEAESAARLRAQIEALGRALGPRKRAPR